jgi:hypothetical protein
VSLWRTLKAQFLVMLVTAPLFLGSGFALFWVVLQIFEFSPSVFFATAMPFLLVWIGLQHWLTRRLENRWSQREQIKQ